MPAVGWRRRRGAVAAHPAAAQRGSSPPTSVRAHTHALRARARSRSPSKPWRSAHRPATPAVSIFRRNVPFARNRRYTTARAANGHHKPRDGLHTAYCVACGPPSCPTVLKSTQHRRHRPLAHDTRHITARATRGHANRGTAFQQPSASPNGVQDATRAHKRPRATPPHAHVRCGASPRHSRHLGARTASPPSWAHSTVSQRARGGALGRPFPRHALHRTVALTCDRSSSRHPCAIQGGLSRHTTPRFTLLGCFARGRLSRVLSRTIRARCHHRTLVTLCSSPGPISVSVPGYSACLYLLSRHPIEPKTVHQALRAASLFYRVTRKDDGAR